MRWEQRLEERNFEDVVNADEQVYQDNDDISIDSECVADQVLAVVHNHISEIWSPPRETKLAG